MKTCKRCAARKPDDSFHLIFSHGKFYRYTYCKLCQRILARERWRRNQLAKKADSVPLLPGCDQIGFGASLTTP